MLPCRLRILAIDDLCFLTYRSLARLIEREGAVIAQSHQPLATAYAIAQHEGLAVAGSNADAKARHLGVPANVAGPAQLPTFLAYELSARIPKSVDLQLREVHVSPLLAVAVHQVSRSDVTYMSPHYIVCHHSTSVNDVSINVGIVWEEVNKRGVTGVRESDLEPQVRRTGLTH